MSRPATIAITYDRTLTNLLRRWPKLTTYANAVLLAVAIALTATNRAFLASSLCGIIAFAIYFHSIHTGETRPSRLGWMMYLVSYAFWLVVQGKSGTTGGLWLIGAEFLGVGATCALSLTRYGTKEADVYDWLLLAASFAGIASWAVTRNTTVAIIVQLVVEWSANVINARKTYRYGAESIPSWLWVVPSGVLGLFATRGSPLPLYGLPLTIALGACLMVAADRLRRRRELAS